MSRFFLALFVAITFLSCKPQPDLADLVENMVVVTYYDKSTLDTASFQTFYTRIDTLGFVSNYYSDTIITPGVNYYNLGALADQLPVFVETEIQGLNLSSVSLDQDPDLILNIIVLDNLNVSLTYNYPSYYNGYYGYYGYYYPYYSYNYEQFGTLVMELLDAKNYAANGNKYKIIWTAYIGDLYTTFDVVEESKQAAHQAFIQSPYLSQN